MGVFQTMFSVSDQVKGRPVASLRPSAVGPRQSGQWPSPAAALAWAEDSITAAANSGNQTGWQVIVCNRHFDFLSFTFTVLHVTSYAHNDSIEIAITHAFPAGAIQSESRAHAL
jgi:hypothetical protein